jgi:hypothetical protein
MSELKLFAWYWSDSVEVTLLLNSNYSFYVTNVREFESVEIASDCSRKVGLNYDIDTLQLALTNKIRRM